MNTLTKGQRTRQRIIEAGFICFGRKGFQSATLDEVAKLSKTQRPAIIKYFGSKSGLLSACVMSVLDRVALEMREAEANCKNALEVLNLQFEKNLEMAMYREGEVQVVMLFYILASHEDELSMNFDTAISRIRERYTSIVIAVAQEKKIRLKFDAQEIGKMLHQFTIGAIVLLLAGSKSKKQFTELRKQWDFLVSSLLKSPP